MKDENTFLGCQFDKVLVPYPSDQICGVVLVFGKPKFAFLANDIEYLERSLVSLARCI